MAVRADKYGFGGWSVTAAGTSSGVTATHTKTAAASQCLVTGVQCSGDAAAVVTVESPSGTVLWRKRFTAAFTHSEGFAPPVEGAAANDILVKISASTSNCEANMQGYDV